MTKPHAAWCAVTTRSIVAFDSQGVAQVLWRHAFRKLRCHTDTTCGAHGHREPPPSTASRTQCRRSHKAPDQLGSCACPQSSKCPSSNKHVRKTNWSWQTHILSIAPPSQGLPLALLCQLLFLLCPSLGLVAPEALGARCKIVRIAVATVPVAGTELLAASAAAAAATIAHVRACTHAKHSHRLTHPDCAARSYGWVLQHALAVFCHPFFGLSVRPPGPWLPLHVEDSPGGGGPCWGHHLAPPHL